MFVRGTKLIVRSCISCRRRAAVTKLTSTESKHHKELQTVLLIYIHSVDIFVIYLPRDWCRREPFADVGLCNFWLTTNEKSIEKSQKYPNEENTTHTKQQNNGTEDTQCSCIFKKSTCKK